VDPADLTLQELVWMVEGRTQEDWNHTASVLAMVANVNRDPKKGRPLRPGDFHPHVKPTASEPPPPQAPVSLLKSVFVDNTPTQKLS
jgi:hypothetical protein